MSVQRVHITDSKLKTGEGETMKTQIASTYGIVMLAAALLASGIASAQPGPGFGRGAGAGHRDDDRHEADHKDFHFLLTNRQQIKRDVKELEEGVETLTESDNPEVAAKIKEHVKWMQHRVEETKPIRMRDPLFAELFRHTDKIKMVRVETEKGVKVTETSEDEAVAILIKAHAKLVSAFVANGFEEARKNHPVPEQPNSTPTPAANPVIADYGKIVPLPIAAQQPRDGSKIVVDVTKGGEPDKLNDAIEKVARFVNIYAGAGKEPASVKIAVVLHGDATLAILNTEAYAKRFKTKQNPNLDCLHKLRDAGVEVFVCGQSLISKGANSEEVDPQATVAVSALTSLVNLQAEGYAYVPLK